MSDTYYLLFVILLKFVNAYLTAIHLSEINAYYNSLFASAVCW